MNTDSLFAVFVSLLGVLNCLPTPMPEPPVPDAGPRPIPAVVCDVETRGNNGHTIVYAKSTLPITVDYAIAVKASGSGNTASIVQGGSSDLKPGIRKELKELRLNGFTSVSGDVSINWKGGETSCAIG